MLIKIGVYLGKVGNTLEAAFMTLSVILVLLRMPMAWYWPIRSTSSSSLNAFV